MKHAAATLGSGNLRLAVMLPEGEDLNEWVAVNSKLYVINSCSLFVFLKHLRCLFPQKFDMLLLWRFACFFFHIRVDVSQFQVSNHLLSLLT